MFWRHADWLESKVPDGRVPVWVNLDETAVNYSYHSAKGLVSSLAWRKKPQLLVPKRDRRGTITHIALISNVTRVQEHLPQVLVANKRRLSRSLLAQLDVAKPDNVWIFRRASSWNTTDIMQWIIQMIGHVFRTKLAGLGFQPILLLDAASVHTAQSVIRTARLQHVFLAPIPPACTAFVQPLDVYTFARYKRFLEDQFREHRMVRTGPVSVHEWFKLLFRACDWLRSEPWHVAFSLSGLPNLGLELHRDLAKLFPGGRVTFCQPERLSPAELGMLLPKNHKLLHEQWIGAPEGLVPLLD